MMRRKWILNKPVKGVKLNPGHPLSRGLVGFWLMNEGSGDKVFDLSGSGHDGVFVNNTHWVSGKFGPALDFDGADDSVLISNDVITTKPLTLSAWVVGDGLGAERYSIISINDGSDTNDFRIMLRNADVRFVVNQAGTDNLDANVTLVSGQYYHIAATIDSVGNTAIYVDGILRNTGAAIKVPAGLIRVEIGIRDGQQDLDGRIDKVMIYNRALSASEISLLYREPFCMFERQEIVFLAVAVGPANLLSVNAVTTANIKSINAVLIGSVKSINAIA